MKTSIVKLIYDFIVTKFYLYFVFFKSETLNEELKNQQDCKNTKGL